MIWPFKSKSSLTDANERPIENPRLRDALAAHEKYRSQQTHLRLLQELNAARYLAACQDDAVKYVTDQTTGSKTIDPESRFKILMASAPNGERLVALFTDYAELTAWAGGKAAASWSFRAQEAWSFAQSASAGVIVNPGGAAWVMGPEHIEWLQKHPL
jgi:type III secretion system (T3SS) SseB-like protein